MAQSEHLPIYKAAYDLCLHLEQVVQGFSRSHRYTLGTELRDGARRALQLVVRANSRADKVPRLLELREELEALKVVVRLAHDLKAFKSFRSFEHAIGLVISIAKQNEGWLKSQGHGRNRQEMPDGLPAPSEPRSQGPPPA
jgi:hypothetical protein